MSLVNHLRSVIITALILANGYSEIVAQQDVGGLTPAIGAKIGTSVGSPIPIGNIPEGATGNAVLGLVVGGWVDWYSGQEWSVVSELQFVHYGSSFVTPLDNQPYIDRVPVTSPDGSTVIFEVNTVFTGTATGQFSNNYIQLPVYAAWKPLDKWRFIGGAYLGWLVSTQSYAIGVGNVGIRPEVVEKDMYFNEKLNGLDYGVQIGTQFEPLDGLAVDLRGVLGLTSIFDQDFQTVDRTVQNTYVHLTLSYRVF